MLNQVIRFSLNHRLFVVGLAILLSGLGLLTLSSAPVDVFPDLNRPAVNIMTEAGGLAAEEVETMVTVPLETTLNGLPGVERVRSSSGIGLSVVTVEFGWATDIYRNRQLIAEKLALAKEKLPAGITPTMGPIASIMGEIQLVGLTSPDGSVSPMDLRTLADWTLRPRLLGIPGITQVINLGGGVRQFQILLSAEKIQKFRLSLDEIERSLSQIGRNSTGGYIDLDKKEFLIRNIGQVRGEEDILKSVVGLHLGSPVLVRDIAAVKAGHQVKRGDASINAKPAVILSIQKQPGANTIELTKKIDETLAEIAPSLPKGVQLERELFKQSHFIESAIGNVRHALRDGTILVFIILLLFLANLRTTAITLTAIPLSFLTSLIVFKFLGITINTMTLGGLAIAIGELVDDAIVDVENVFRRLRENAKRPAPLPTLRVIFDASSEVRNSIVFSTLIVILVFVPLFFLSGIEGRLFVPLGIAYITALLSSLIVSLTLTPVLCYYLLGSGKLIQQTEGRFAQWLKRVHRLWLERALGHPKIAIGASLALLLGALALIPSIGREFLPRFNEGTATVNILAAPGISLEESNRLGTQAEEILLGIPEVKSVARRTGRAELDEHAEGVHYGEIDVDFKEGGRNRPVVLNDMREQLLRLPGVYVNIGQPISHRLDHLLSGVRSQIAIKLFGPELKVLREKSAEISTALKGTPGLVDLQVEQQALVPQIKIHLMRDEAAKFGIVIGDLATALQVALNGEVVAQVLESQQVINVFLRYDEQSRSNIELMKQTTLKILPDGTRVTLSKVADVYESTGPNIIQREAARRRIVISANVQGRDLHSVVTELQARIAKSVALPTGYDLQFGGQFEQQRSALTLLLVLGALAVMAVFVVLSSHFRSHLLAGQVMLNIPLALIGSLVAIFVTERLFSVSTLVAFITLCGIASRNGIMMISHYLHLMRFEGEGFSRELVVRGTLERLVPVLMTALTAALALLPLVFAGGAPGKEILHPVAVVIVGGLLSSTLLDMFVTPTIFFHFGKKSALNAVAKHQGEIL